MFLHVNKQGCIVGQPQLAHGADFLRADGLLAAMQVRGDLAIINDGGLTARLEFPMTA